MSKKSGQFTKRKVNDVNSGVEVDAIVGESPRIARSIRVETKASTSED